MVSHGAVPPMPRYRLRKVSSRTSSIRSGHVALVAHPLAGAVEEVGDMESSHESVVGLTEQPTVPRVLNRLRVDVMTEVTLGLASANSVTINAPLLPVVVVNVIRAVTD